MSFDKKAWSARRYQERKKELAAQRADPQWKERRAEWSRQHRAANAERLRMYDRERYHNGLHKKSPPTDDQRRRKREADRRHRSDNINRIRAQQKDYYARNKQDFIIYGAAYMAKRLKEDDEFRLRCLLRSRVREALKTSGARKSARTMELIGCDIPTLRAHLEAQFKPEMTWDNHGLHGWHIDHREPCSRFDLTDPEQQRKCFHYSNLQPLWWYENISKGNKTLCA